jgi:small multidrug resistance pump
MRCNISSVRCSYCSASYAASHLTEIDPAWTFVQLESRADIPGARSQAEKGSEVGIDVERSPSVAWLLLGLAIMFEIAGALGLRFSEGFTLLLSTGIALFAFTLALYLVSQVMKKLPVSVAYPIWAGGGTAGVSLLGVLVLGEALSATKALGIVLVMIGVILVNRSSDKQSGC